MFAEMLARLREFVRPFYLRFLYFRLFPDRKPPYFSTCWNFPALTLEDLTKPNTKPVVLFLPLNDWHTRIQRTQHLARGLSQRGYRCIYLNPHLGRQFPDGFDKGQPARVTRLADNLFELHVHLRREPVFHHRRLTPAESASIAATVSELLETLKATSLVQILAFPVWLDAARLLRNRHNAPILYDCHDYLPGFTRIAQPLIDLEPDTFRASDTILCSSGKLMDRARSFAPQKRMVLLRNAAAAEFLKIPRIRSPKITVGYIGALDSWFDVASLEAAASAHPDWRFQLIGRLEDEAVGALRRFPNVQFPGEIPFAQIGPFLSAFAVAIIPFVINPLIEATDPIKAYEYLAAGIPIVAADLGELARFEGLIARYRDPADFVRKLETAIASDSVELTAHRRAAAAHETWDQRADLLAASIDSVQCNPFV